MKKFSIIIITYKRPQLLQHCLQNILQHQKDHLFEIFVVINDEDNETYLLLKNSFPSIKIIQTHKKNPETARNLAISKCQEEYIFFLNNNTILPFDYFENVEEILTNHSHLDIFGKPNTTYPNSKPFEKAISIAITSPLAMAKTHFHHKSNHDNQPSNENKLILCNI